MFFFFDNIESTKTITKRNINPKTAAGILYIANQGKTIQKQLPASHGSPVVNSTNHDPIIPIRIGDSPIKITTVIHSGNFVK